MLTYVKGNYRFEKEQGSNLVEVTNDEYGDYVFTDYSIGDSQERFEESCEEVIEYLKEAHDWV